MSGDDAGAKSRHRNGRAPANAVVGRTDSQPAVFLAGIGDDLAAVQDHLILEPGPVGEELAVGTEGQVPDTPETVAVAGQADLVGTEVLAVDDQHRSALDAGPVGEILAVRTEQ